MVVLLYWLADAVGVSDTNLTPDLKSNFDNLLLEMKVLNSYIGPYLGEVAAATPIFVVEFLLVWLILISPRFCVLLNRRWRIGSMAQCLAN